MRWTWFGVAAAGLGWALWPRPAADPCVALDAGLGDAAHSAPRSLYSSGPSGLRELGRRLNAAGVCVVAWRTPLLPPAGKLVLLGPKAPLTELEQRRWLDWVRGGGQLLYAPFTLTVQVQDPGRAPTQLAVPDPFLVLMGPVVPRPGEAVTLPLGQGSVLLLPDAHALGNATLADGETPLPSAVAAWLAGAARVYFDETHSGAWPARGWWELFHRSPFAVVWRLLCVLMLLAVIGELVRPRAQPPRAHLDG